MFYMTRRLTEREIHAQLGSALKDHSDAMHEIAEEYAASWNADKRREAAKRGDALPDGSFPIVDQEDLNNAVRLVGNSSHPKTTVVAHVKKQAKKHGLKLPDSMSGN